MMILIMETLLTDIKNVFRALAVTGVSVLLYACATDRFEEMEVIPSEAGRIEIAGNIEQEYVTRANDNGFADGDEVGIYVVDYNGDNPGTLENQGNRADNVRYAYNEAGNRWVPSYDIYWKDKTTHIDVYGYYPFGSPENVENYSFEVQKDQGKDPVDGNMSPYEASDFLWGKSENNAPTDKVIRLAFKHKLAGIRVSLEKGSNWADGEWENAEKQILVLSTTRTAQINLRTGVAKAVGEAPQTGIIPVRHNSDWRAIVVPQTVKSGNTLICATVAGVPYNLKKAEDFVYIPGKQHNFTLTVNKRAEGGYEFVLSSESIVMWENDPVSHDAVAREYAVINVAKAGTLDACIVADGKQLSKVRNLKITGEINSRDFAVMRYEMTDLRALNLKEVKIVAVEGGSLAATTDTGYDANEDDEIPNGALSGKVSLVSLVLPDKLLRICGAQGGGEGRGAFSECMNLSGSLVIPEGVVEIGPAAFRDCYSLTGTLSLPSTLKILGDITKPREDDGPFYNCGFVCKLLLPESLEVIGNGCFGQCKGLYGELRLPEHVKEIGNNAFDGCVNMTGSLVIPQGITDIHESCFRGMGLNGTLTLHDGINTIGQYAFASTAFKGELRLPKNLEVVSSEAFCSCDFSGELKLPKTLMTIGDRAFAYNWRLMGVLEIPDGVLSIGFGAFAHCRSLEGVIFNAALESIRYEPSYWEDGGAFQDCYGIGKIVCKGTIPPYVLEGAFNGVPKDNFTLEVPESAIQQYQAAPGWSSFKRISAYRNLVIRPMAATAINTSVTRDLVLTADDSWTCIDKPDWVTLDKMYGTGKAEIKLTFARKPKDGRVREGKVVFKLDGKDYRTECAVSQYDFDYDEDEVITLQSHSKGNGVNLVILGDGFSAKDLSEGNLLSSINEAYENFFGIEPYKTYRDYFNVYTAASVSPESGIGGINTIVNTKFNTSSTDGVALVGKNGDSDYNDIFRYACNAPTVNAGNITQTLVIMVANTYDYGGICYMYEDGSAIAYCPMSDYGYPLDYRGVVQHEAGGHGFGKLGDEYIYHNAFITACGCICCPHEVDLQYHQALGWYQNLSLSGKMNEVPWRDFIFHEKYRDIVDVFEGGFMHNRGVYRSEQNSCMNNDIPYYSTISRYEIAKRIMAYAGESFSFDKFVANDVIDGTVTKASDERWRFDADKDSRTAATYQSEPVIVGVKPNLD